MPSQQHHDFSNLPNWEMKPFCRDEYWFDTMSDYVVTLLSELEFSQASGADVIDAENSGRASRSLMVGRNVRCH